MISDNMAKTKTLTVTITESREQTETNFKAKGLSDFEIVGILSYYLDAYKVKMLRAPGRVVGQEETEKE